MGLLVVIGYLVVVPLGAIVYGSVRTAPLGVAGGLTIDNFRTALDSPTLLPSLRNSLAFTTGSSVLAVALGGYLAWVAEQSSEQLRRIVSGFVIASLIVPGILTTVAWTLLLHERIGLLNLALGSMGLPTPFDAYTMTAMVWADGSDGIVLPFLLIAAALRARDPDHEHAAVLAGATPLRIRWTVTLPLLRPAVLTAFLLSFIRALGTFAVPAAMGIPGGIRVFATEVYLQSRVFPGNANLAAAYAMVYLSVALFALGAYSLATRGDGRFVTVAGRGLRPEEPAPGSGRRVHVAAASAIVVTTIILPFIVMLYTSVLPYYRTPQSGLTSMMTLQQYEWVLSSGIVRRALVNNLVVGLGAAVAAMLLAAAVAWRVVRRPGGLSRTLDVLSTLPIALPGTVLALALLWWYLYLPLPLYATRWVLGFGLVTTFLPYGARVLQAALLQLGRELEEASEVVGARRVTTFVRIVLPLLLPSAIAAAIYMLSRSFKALALPALLSGPGAEVLPIVIYSLYTDGRYPELNALGVLLTVGLGVLTVVANVVLRNGRFRRSSARAREQFVRPETAL